MNKGLFQRLLPHLIALVIFLIAALLFCKPALEGQVLQQHDIVGAKAMAHNALEYQKLHGHLPLWNTHLFSGMPNYQIAVEGPRNFFYQDWVRNFGLPKPFSFFFVACVCFYILSIAFRINPYIGIFAALSYAYATYDPVIISAGHDTKMMAMAYAPALLAGIVWLYEKRYWLGFAITALFATMEITANHPQINYYLFIVIAFMTISYLAAWVKRKQWKHTAIALSLAILGAVIGVAYAAVSFFPTYDYSKYTMRGGGTIETTPNGQVVEKKTTGLDYDYAFSYSLGKAEALTLAMPDAFGGSSSETLADNQKFINALGEKGIPEASAEQVANQLPKYWGGIELGTSGPAYLGAICCLLFVIGLAVLKSHHRWWLLAGVVLSIFMAWGKYFPSFNDFLYHHLPLYNKFRAPSMSLVITQLLVPIMAMLTVQQILFTNKTEEEIKRHTKYVLYAMGGLIVLAALVYMVSDYNSSIDQEIIKQAGEENGRMFVNAMKSARKAMLGAGLLRLIGFAAFLTALLFLWKRKIVSPLAFIIVLTLVNTVDLFVVGKQYLNENNYVDSEEAFTENNFQPTLADQEILKDTDPHYRVYALTPDRFMSAPTTNRTSYFHRAVGGYHPAKLRIYQDLIEGQLSKSPLNMDVLNMLDTRYFLIPDQQGNITSVHKNDSALGAAWFIKKLQPVNGPAAEMKALDHFDPKDTAYYNKETEHINTQFTWDSTATIQLTKYDNDTIVYTTNALSPQFAVFSEIYYPAGWNAYIDGKQTDYYKVDYLLRGIPVPAGKHEVVFRFEPTSYTASYKLAWWAGLILNIVLIVCIARWIWKKRRESLPEKA
ncbi:MAG: YfhO family protein [Flavisolibacter sp.]